MGNGIDGLGMQLQKIKKNKKMQLHSTDKVFNSGGSLVGCFPFVISLIKVQRSLYWIWECQSIAGKGAEGMITLGDLQGARGSREEIMQSTM